MGSQLRWLERTPDKREVDGSIPFEPTTKLIITLSFKFWNYKQVVQGKRGRICEIVLMYIEQIMTKFDTAIRSLEFQRKHIEKYIDEK